MSSAMDIWTAINDFFVRKLWGTDISSFGRVRTFVIKLLRLLYVALREFSEGQVNLRAMSLVYTTLLSLVPLLAVSFSVLKAFGVHNLLEPLLTNFLTPLGPRGVEITERVIGFVENLRVGVLGSLGLALLIYTVVSLIQKIEDAFNYIWKIKKPRSLARRFSDYMSVILVGPVLIFSAIGLTASIMSSGVVQRIIAMEPFGTAVFYMGKLIPYVFVCAAFTFIYIFVPSVKVRFRSALVGAIFAGVLWQSAGWGFASFIVTSTKYAAIYSGFAILIMFMIWLYISWLILLVGAQVTFYHQYPQFLFVKKGELLLSSRLKERLGLLVMFLIGSNHYQDGPPCTLNTLVGRLGLPVEPVQDVLTVLEKSRLVVESADEPAAYLPGKDIETITLREVLEAIRAAEEEYYTVEERFITLPEVDKVIKDVNSAIEKTLDGETVKSLILKGK
jgi:membrane protein